MLVLQHRAGPIKPLEHFTLLIGGDTSPGRSPVPPVIAALARLRSRTVIGPLPPVLHRALSQVQQSQQRHRWCFSSSA
jgi:hypothetical protein